MPIQVKDYIWEETDETVLITVPLKGVPSNRVDIFSIDDYIKVSFECVHTVGRDRLKWKEFPMSHVIDEKILTEYHL